MSDADLLAADYLHRLRTYAERDPSRYAVDVDGLLVAHMGVPAEWATHVAAVTGRPEPAAVERAVAFARDRGHEPWVLVRASDRDVLADLPVADELPAMIAPVGGSASSLLVVRPATSAAEFAEVYGDSFGMPEGQAEALVVPADLTTPSMSYLVGLTDGDVVACAQLRVNGPLGYVSALGVRPQQRSRGYGIAMLETCRARAAELGCDRVWLSASPRTAPFYRRLGFALVDTHVALSAR